MVQQERWQVSGSAAEQYERFVASWFEPWALDLISAAGVTAGWRVLDVACGTGVVTRAAARAIGSEGEVVATDLNEGMLAEAQKHTVEGAPVQWRSADAAQLPFGPEEFDAVLCQQGLQFVPDKSAAAAQMLRVLRPGAVAAVSVWASLDDNPYIAALSEGLGRHLSAEAGAVMAAPCSFGDPGELRQLFVDVGFTNVVVSTRTRHRNPTPVLDAVVGNLLALPIAEQVDAMPEAGRAAMLEDILGALGSHVNDGQLTAPATSNVVVAAA